MLYQDAVNELNEFGIRFLKTFEEDSFVILEVTFDSINKQIYHKHCNKKEATAFLLDLRTKLTNMKKEYKESGEVEDDIAVVIVNNNEVVLNFSTDGIEWEEA